MRPSHLLQTCLVPALIGLASCPALAHDPLPPSWCTTPNSRPVLVATFTLSAAQLEAYKLEQARQRGIELPCPTDKSCGIVDDWHWANEQADAYCGSLTRGAADTVRAIPVMTAPETFLNLSHHADYRSSQGLSGMCVACPSTSPRLHVERPGPIEGGRP